MNPRRGLGAALKAIAATGADAELVGRAEKLLSGARLLGGRGPYLIALAALYTASEGRLSLFLLRFNVYELRTAQHDVVVPRLRTGAQGLWRGFS